MILIHILRTDNGKENMFLIQDMFSITEEYVDRKYKIAGNHMKVTSEHAAKKFEHKSKRILEMTKRGIKFVPTQPDTLGLKKCY